MPGKLEYTWERERDISRSHGMRYNDGVSVPASRGESPVMASRTRIREVKTLEEFLELPEDKPALEYIDGRIEAKLAPQKKHTEIEAELRNCFNAFATPRK